MGYNPWGRKESDTTERLLSCVCLFLLLFPLLWEVDHRGSCCDLCQRLFCLVSSRSFIVSGLTLRSFIHFDFILVYGVMGNEIFLAISVNKDVTVVSDCSPPT